MWHNRDARETSAERYLRYPAERSNEGRAPPRAMEPEGGERVMITEDNASGTMKRGPARRSQTDPTGTSGTSGTPSAGGASSAASEEYLRIEQVAARTGLTKRTLRYYEEIGVLAPPSRTEGGYRLYSEHDVQELERIKRLKDLLGFSLAEIREMVHAEEEREHVRAAWE